jgi:hypothetical protein
MCSQQKRPARVRHPRTTSVGLRGLIRGRPPPAGEKVVFCVPSALRLTWRAACEPARGAARGMREQP